MRRDEITERAQQLIANSKITSPPVPVEKLIQVCGARTVFRSLDDGVSGFVLREKGTTPIVGINSYHSSVRQRFTMAHELGHLLLHKTSKIHIDETDFFIKFRDAQSSDGSDRDEREANGFAAALLMPDAFLKTDLRKLGDIGLHDDQKLQALAKRYGVSLQAMLIRLTSLRLIESPVSKV